MSIIPFAIGTEYINERWIKNNIKHLNEQFKKDMTSYKGTKTNVSSKKVSGFKRSAKRIYFHLVENEEDTEFPFRISCHICNKKM